MTGIYFRSSKNPFHSFIFTLSSQEVTKLSSSFSQNSKEIEILILFGQLIFVEWSSFFFSRQNQHYPSFSPAIIWGPTFSLIGTKLD